MDQKDMFISFYEWKTQREFSIPRNCSTKALEPCLTKHISCSVQTLSISDLGREIGKLKKFIKEQEKKTEQKKEKVLQIQHKKFHVLMDLKIQGIPFQLKTLLDIGSDLNLLNKQIIPVNFWQKTQASVVGLGNIPTEISFQISEATLCFKQYCLHLKFLLVDIPIACILGIPFFAAIEPHGSTMLENNRPGYFISIPSFSKNKKVTINLPFVSAPRISDMVHTIK
jgi:hypothetical protein